MNSTSMTVGGNNLNLTPLMKQYWDLKSQATDSLLLFRMGDFYELFAEDAIEASKILSITLTSRDRNKENPLPMAGVPYHSVDGYLSKLLKAGKKVAIAEQLKEITLPSGKTLVERAIVRTLTPAIQFNLDSASSDPQYLAVLLPVGPRGADSPVHRGTSSSVHPNTDSKEQWILACLDPATGESRVSEPLNQALVLSEFASLPIKHWLRVGHEMPILLAQMLSNQTGILVEDLPSNYCSFEQAKTILQDQYGFAVLDYFLKHEQAILALGILVYYTLKTQKQDRLAYLQLPEPLKSSGTMVLGPSTHDHLDLLPSPDGTPSLFEFLNQTQTSAGSRLLKTWITQPLILQAPIYERQKALQLLSKNFKILKPELAKAYDLERILGRIHTGLANPRDTLALGQTLKLHQFFLVTISSLCPPDSLDKNNSAKILLEQNTLFNQPLDQNQSNQAYNHGSSILTSEILEQFKTTLQQDAQEIAELSDLIIARQCDNAPLVTRDGGIFNPGFDSNLDHLIELTQNGERFLVDLEARERTASQIPSLKVKYNRVFGYYIEITSSHLKNVPAHYQRKQTMVGGERFFTEELKKFEDEILNAQERKKALELKLFLELIQTILTKTAVIQRFAKLIANLDVLNSLSALVQKTGFVFPEFLNSNEILIQAGRHPMVDAVRSQSYVPNDLILKDPSRVMLITGPNMGGKSTLMRQVAIIAIMAQMGAPVPAKSAQLGIVKSLFTRMGAHDAIAKGQSTFMVEMGELAHLLRLADQDSLLILDEIGRGTSTYDGMSVAWATLEWIATKIKARCLFATHYHELTQLEHSLPGLINAHMAVAQSKPLRFQYQLKAGPTHQSFGIQVAEMAGLPVPVVARAWRVLKEFENKPAEQLSLFEQSKLESDSLTDSTNSLEFLDSSQQLQSTSAQLPLHDFTERQLELFQSVRTMDLNELTPIKALTLLIDIQKELELKTF